MTRSRKYLYNLPNALKIKQLAGEILDYELKLDNAKSENQIIKKEILTLETQLISLEGTENQHIIEKTNKRLDELSKDIINNEKELNNLKRHVSSLKSIADAEIREGLSTLYNQAKSEIDEAQISILHHQKMAKEAQNKFASSSKEDAQHYRDLWIRHVERIIEDEEKLKKSQEQLEAIKRIYKLEFG